MATALMEEEMKKAKREQISRVQSEEAGRQQKKMAKIAEPGKPKRGGGGPRRFGM